MITFVLPAITEVNDAYVSLGSLMCQTNPAWEAIVINNGCNLRLRELIEKAFGFDNRVIYAESEEVTGTALANRLTALNMAQPGYVIQSSIQDYYVPETVELLHSAILRESYDFIYWNSINHHYHPNVVMECFPTRMRIDWGNFAVRVEMAKEIGYMHLDDNMADGLFVEELIQKLNPKKYKIDRMLTVHN